MTKNYTETHTRLGPGGVATGSLNSGDMSASGFITFASVAALAATGTLAAVGAQLFDDSADLDARGSLVAVGALTLAGTADLDAPGQLVASAALTFATDADLDALGELDAVGAMAFDSFASIEGTANNVSAGGSLSWSTSAALTAIGEMAGAGALAFASDADISSPADVVAAGSISFEGNAELAATGSLVAAGALVWSSSSANLISPAVDLEATGALAFSGNANLGQATAQASLSVPTWPVSIRNFRIDLNEDKTITESLFTRTRQVVSLSAGTADRWAGLITTPMLTPANVRVMMNFLVEVGLYGQFTIQHPDYEGPTSGETVRVNGSGQTGTTLAVDGLPASVTYAEEGDWFQVGNELKRLTEDATTNGSGEVTLNFRPALRVSPFNNDEVEFATPMLLAELTTIPGEETSSLRMMSFTISFQEALLSV